ncbi:MAG: 3-deoxy-7-phosphoheptulonate synthase, partial [Candidatus Omnitrophica bacterium]|nr:3-deoxy-7-phosphoheptulonate synthase [Candidatus Omnitrophota bacterium]
MIIVLDPKATKADVDHLIEKIHSLELRTMVSKGTERTIVGVIGDESLLRGEPLEAYSGVEKVLAIQTPYKMVSAESTGGKPRPINLGKGVKLGGKEIVVMAGPCTIESRERTLKLAKYVKAKGAKVLRGGAFKPRTSPYDFQGLGEQALEWLAEAGKKHDMLIVTEMMDVRDLDLFEKYADIIQIGARNMGNVDLLAAVGKTQKPILLKRGLANTVEDFLMAAEEVYAQGNHRVILCERGIRTFETTTRFTLDVGSIPVLKAKSH